jgi:AraC family transcriptional regulator, L-rhamnose operon regulatory protein RhaS
MPMTLNETRLHREPHAAFETMSGRLPHRVVYGGREVGGTRLIPEIGEIGWGRFDVADPYHLKPHSHPRAFEICMIVAGEVEWETLEQSHVLRAGDIFVTQPGQLHWGRDNAMQPCSLYWLKLDVGVMGEAAATLKTMLARVPNRLTDAAGVLQPLLEAIFAEHGRADTELGAIAARAALQQFLVGIIRLADGAAMPARAALPAVVQRAVEMIRLGDHAGLTARDIALAVQERPARLNELFIAHFGMTIAQFSLRERVRVARASLRATGKSVTEIANELGFSSSQHFATTFKRMTGMSPSLYRGEHPGTALDS